MTGGFSARFVVVALAVLCPSVSAGRPFVQKAPGDCPELGTGPPKLHGNCTTELTEKEGGTASLRCPLSADLSRSTFRASKDQSTNIVHIRTNNRDRFRTDRTSLSDEAWKRGIAELNISSLELDDAGIYEFYLDGHFKCQFLLGVVKSQEPSEDGEAPTSTPAPSEMPRPSTPPGDQHSDNTWIYVVIGISAVVFAAIAIGLGVSCRRRRNTDTNMADDSGEAGEVDPCLDGPAKGMSDAEPDICMSQLHPPVEEEGTSSVPFNMGQHA